MKLNKNSWHARWFRFVQRFIGSEYDYEDGTNICHYIRVCFLWGSIVVTIMAALFSAVVFILLIAPFFYGIWVGPLFVGVGLSAVALFYGIFRLYGMYGSKLAPVGSVAYCAYEHARGVKEKFCPIVKFEDK